MAKHKIKLDCAIFVSPCFDRLGLVPWQYDLVNTTFYKTDYVLYSDNDPYIEPRRALRFAKAMESSLVFVKRAGHLNAEVNLNEFPLVFDLCATRLDLSSYQRYVLERTKDSIAQNIINSNKKYLTIGSEEVADEGRFHFMNISKTGFATFPSGSKGWDPEDEYFINGRKASKRGVSISRVFVIKDIKNLDKKDLQKQIELDLKAGIRVMFIKYEVYKTLGAEEDFGVWHDEYTCTIRRDKQGNVLDALLDSRPESIAKASAWREKILKKSIQIRAMADVKEWKKKNRLS